MPVRLAPSGSLTLLGDPGGLLAKEYRTGFFENDKLQSFLCDANNVQRGTKTATDGQVIWSMNFCDWERERPLSFPIRPTDAIVIPNSDILIVPDGYGSSWIYVLNKTTGVFLEGKSFGGFENSANLVKVDTRFSVSLDEKGSGQPSRFLVFDS